MDTLIEFVIFCFALLIQVSVCTLLWYAFYRLEAVWNKTYHPMPLSFYLHTRFKLIMIFVVCVDVFLWATGDHP